MDLYKEILIKALGQQKMQITFPDLKMDINEILELHSYQALQKIKAIINDDSLTDSECFMKIEEIIDILETFGSGGGNRHDFG